MHTLVAETLKAYEDVFKPASDADVRMRASVNIEKHITNNYNIGRTHLDMGWLESADDKLKDFIVKHVPKEQTHIILSQTELDLLEDVQSLGRGTIESRTSPSEVAVFHSASYKGYNFLIYRYINKEGKTVSSYFAFVWPKSVSEAEIFKPASDKDLKQRKEAKLYIDMKDAYARWTKNRLKPKVLGFGDSAMKRFIIQHTPKQVGYVEIGDKQRFKSLENVKELDTIKWGMFTNTFYSASYKDYNLLVWRPQVDYEADYCAYIWPKQVSEAEIFKPVTKEEAYARQISRFKKLDISKFETKDDYIKAMQPPYIRLWNGVYPEDERLRFDTVFAYGAVPGIHPISVTKYIWHAIEIVSDKTTGKLLAVWDLGEYNDAGHAEDVLRGFDPAFIIKDLKSQGLIEAKDIFKPVTDKEAEQRYALNPHKPVKITSLDQLKQLASGETAIDINVFLSGGVIRSSKRVSYEPSTGMWWVFNYIDDSETETKDLMDTNIPLAIERGALYYDPSSNESVVSERDIFKQATPEDIIARENQWKAVQAAEKAERKAKRDAYYASIPYTYEQIVQLPQYKKIMALDNGLSTATASRETVKDLTSEVMEKHKSTKFRLIYGLKRWDFKDYFVKANGYIHSPNSYGSPYSHVMRYKSRGAATTLEQYGGLLDELYDMMVRKLRKQGVSVSEAQDIFKPATEDDVQKRASARLYQRIKDKDVLHRGGAMYVLSQVMAGRIPAVRRFLDNYIIGDDIGWSELRAEEFNSLEGLELLKRFNTDVEGERDYYFYLTKLKDLNLLVYKVSRGLREKTAYYTFAWLDK